MATDKERMIAAEQEALMWRIEDACKKALARPMGWRTPQAQQEVENVVATIRAALNRREVLGLWRHGTAASSNSGEGRTCKPTQN